MNAKTRRSLGWLGVLLFGQFVLAKFWYNHGTIRIPAENTFSWWVYFVAILGLAFAGLLVMWSMIKNIKSTTPHKIFLWALAFMVIVTLIIDPSGTTKSIHDINRIMMGVSSQLWFIGTISVIAWDVICLDTKEMRILKRRLVGSANRSNSIEEVE